MAMDENRLVDIETKMAHQEDLLDTLNTVVTEQTAQIARLEELNRSLIDRVRSMADASVVDGPQDDRPPHY
jgi:SlyX protein